MPKILIADRNPHTRRMLSLNLSKRGYRVVIAHDLREVVKLASSERPHLILLEITIPGQSGWDVLQALKNDPHLHRIPLIIMTPFADSGIEAKGRRRGAVGHLVKPFGIPELMRQIRKALREMKYAEDNSGS